MSDIDSSYLDPRGDTPAGSAWQIGDPSQGANDPLVDWASNLHQDDLAKYLQDPQGQAAEWAARGHPPPDQATMDAMHNHNESMGTPSRSSRMDATADSGPLAGPYRVDPRTGRLLNLTDPQNQPSGGKRPIQMYQDYPLQPGEEGPNPIVEKAKKNFEEFGQAKPYPPGTGPGTPPIARKDQPAPAPADSTGGGGFLDRASDLWHRGFGTNQAQASPAGAAGAPSQPAPPAVPAPTPAPAGAVAQPVAPTLPSPSQTPLADAGKKKKDGDGNGSADDKTPGQKIGSALSDLGKAMQGVKAPEPLKPPAGFAPAPRGPLQAGAPNLQALAAMLGGTQTGQVPASVMPILRMLGKA